MRVRDIMTQPAVSCRRETNLAAAARLMLDGRFGTLPVIDGHRVVGIITDRDIAMATAKSQRNAAKIAVHEAMSQPPRLCAADEEAIVALKLMTEGRVRRLPVVDVERRLSGILSIDDLIQRALDRPGGVSTAELVQALVRISEQSPVEPAIDLTETLLPG